MSKQKTIDAFFKKKDVSNLEFRTPVAIEINVAVEINVNTSMSNEHPSKCSRIQSEDIDRDLGSRKQICEFPIKKQDEIRRVYLKEGLYQPKNIDYLYNDDNHHRRKSVTPCKKSWLHPWAPEQMALNGDGLIGEEEKEVALYI